MKKTADTALAITADYRLFMGALKARVTTARFGWSRNVLLNQIKAGAYERAVTEKKTHNFDLALPEHFAEQADEMLKSSYNLDFLGIRRAGPTARLYPSLGQRPGSSGTKKQRAVSPCHRGCGDGSGFQPSLFFLSCSWGFAPGLYGLRRWRTARPFPAELRGKLPSAKQLANVVRAEMGGGR